MTLDDVAPPGAVPVADRSVDPAAVAQDWLDRLGAALVGRADVADLVVAGGWWRDLLVLDWDLHSWQGRERIAHEVRSRPAARQVSGLRLDDVLPPGREPWAGGEVVAATFAFRTPHLAGEGHVRLVPDDGTWRAVTVLTRAAGLHARPERIGADRPWGEPDGGTPGRVPWHVRRAREREFTDGEPEVVVLGGGHAGLALAARLGQLGVPTLVLERNARIGDNWRHRYPTLNLHDPVWLNGLPYLDFPQTFPVFLPRDRFADWLEHYAVALDLAVWTGVRVGRAARDEAADGWTVPVVRADGSRRVLRPRHVVLATGLHGEPSSPAVPGQESFAGRIVHSSAFVPGDGGAGTRAVVVGSGVSAHDISVALWEQGAQVTMVRRSPTIAVTRSSWMAGMAPPPVLGGPAARYLDLQFVSVPWPERVEQQRHQIRRWKVVDGALHARLEERGYQVRFGSGEEGVVARWVQGGRGGTYIDVGALDLVADGLIGVRQGVSIAKVAGTTVTLTDGSSLEADLVVQATGYTDMVDAARQVVGDLADGLEGLHHLDDDGELRAVWRPTGVPGLWVIVGNIQMARVFSQVLALQIAARLDGLVPA